MTMRLQAISVGCGVPRPDFETTVHSVFDGALNLQLAGEALLLTLLWPGQGDLPQGIRVDAPKPFAFPRLPVGTRAVCRDGVLALGEPLTIDLREAREWRCDLSSLHADMESSTVAAAWRYAWEAWREGRRREGAAMLAGHVGDEDLLNTSITAQQMNRAVQSILRATRQCDAAGMEQLADLVGLGAGLTPEGDDLVMGYLAGLWCTARGKPERLDFLAAVGQHVFALSTRTNDISRTYLCHAAHGQVSSRLVELASGICRGADSAGVVGCAEAAMRVGHTSGMAAVCGLLLGLAAWDGSQLLAHATRERADFKAAYGVLPALVNSSA